MSLTDLIKNYQHVYEKIHRNRRKVSELVKQNQRHREELAVAKKLLAEYLEVNGNVSLYQICMKEFGKVDKRFHLLFSLFYK